MQTVQAPSLINGVGGEKLAFIAHIRKVLSHLKHRGRLEDFSLGSIKRLSFYNILTKVTMNEKLVKPIYGEMLCADCDAFLPRSACSRCLTTKFCDVRCQTAHWYAHKGVCRHVAEL